MGQCLPEWFGFNLLAGGLPFNEFLDFMSYKCGMLFVLFLMELVTLRVTSEMVYVNLFLYLFRYNIALSTSW